MVFSTLLHGLLHQFPPSFLLIVFFPWFQVTLFYFFPRKSTTDFVVAEKPFVKTLTAFTVSMWVQMANDSKTNQSTTTLFSYAISDSIDNELSIEIDASEVWVSIRDVITR